MKEHIVDCGDFQLYAPGSRKGNKHWVLRASLGRQVEASTRCVDKQAAITTARQFIRQWGEHERQQQIARIRESKSLVYFITNGLGFVKIGVSTDPNARLRELQTGSTMPLELCGVMPGVEADERAVHRLFAACRQRGEWFRLVPRLERFIRENCLLKPGEILGKPSRPKLQLVDITA